MNYRLIARHHRLTSLFLSFSWNDFCERSLRLRMKTQCARRRGIFYFFSLLFFHENREMHLVSRVVSAKFLFVGKSLGLFIFRSHRIFGEKRSIPLLKRQSYVILEFERYSAIHSDIANDTLFLQLSYPSIRL